MLLILEDLALQFAERCAKEDKGSYGSQKLLYSSQDTCDDALPLAKGLFSFLLASAGM